MTDLNTDHLSQRERYLMSMVYSAFLGYTKDQDHAARQVNHIVKSSDELEPATTPQPSADAVRAIGWLNSDGSSYLPTEKRARMIEAGKREGASVGEVTFGKIAEDHRIALYAAPPSVAGLVTAWRDRINVDPEDPYEHGESDTLMSCADELESLLSAASGEKGVG